MIAAFKIALGEGTILRLLTQAGGALLAEVTFTGAWLSDPAAGSVTMTGVSYNDPLANASGVPLWGIFYKADGVSVVAEASVSGPLGDGAIKLQNPVVSYNEPVLVVGVSFTMPSGG